MENVKELREKVVSKIKSAEMYFQEENFEKFGMKFEAWGVNQRKDDIQIVVEVNPVEVAKYTYLHCVMYDQKGLIIYSERSQLHGIFCDFYVKDDKLERLLDEKIKIKFVATAST